MDYTISQLRVFVQVVESESITKAAEALYLTQPAVSIQLKKFQDQFPIPLTEVIGRKLFITPFGREIASAAQKILLELNEIEYKTKRFQGKLAGKLTLSVVSTGKYVMPYYLAGFVNKHPGIDFSMDVTNKLNVIQDLESNRVDFALISVIPEGLKLNQFSLLPNTLYLVGGEEREKTRRCITKDIFSKEPLLLREQGSATRAAMETFIKSQNISTYRKIELTSNEALKQSVIAGLGYSIMPLIGLRSALVADSIRIIPYRGLPLHTTWNLVWLKNKKLSSVAQSFLTYLSENSDRIRNRYFRWLNDY